MDLPPGMDWEYWRIVKARIATLHEIRAHWTLADLTRAHMALDIEELSQVLSRLE